MSASGGSAARLVLGGAQLGMPYGISNRRAPPDRDAVERILERAWAGGIRAIDTAPGYGDSERLIGIARARLGLDFECFTKLPASVTAPDQVEPSVSASADRLGVERLAGVFLHDPSALLGSAGAETWDALQSLVRSGRIGRAGLSAYSPADLEPLLSLDGSAIVQLPLNLLDQRFADEATIRSLRRRGVAVYARSVFLQGLLLMPASEVEARFPRLGHASVHRALERIDRGAARLGVAVRTLALRFVLTAAGVDRVIVGVTGTDELEQVLRSADETLPADVDWPSMAVDDASVINPRRWSDAA